MADLLEIEQWPEYNAAKFKPLQSRQPVSQLDFFACHLCLKIRSADRFCNAMMKGKRGKLGKGTVEERSKRFCISCGITHGIYQRGIYVRWGGASGQRGFVCWWCGRFESRHCSEVHLAKPERKCAVCSHKKQEPSDWRDVLLRIGMDYSL
jgi:hypothetical protein